MKAIDEAWEENKDIITLNDLVFNREYIRKSQFEKAVKEILKLQREECERVNQKFLKHIKIQELRDLFSEAILNAELIDNDDDFRKKKKSGLLTLVLM